MAADDAAPRRGWTRGIIVIAALIVLGTVGVVTARDRQRLTAEVDRLSAKLELARGDASEQIATLEDSLEQAEGTIATLEADATTLEAELDRTASALEERSDALDAQRALAEELAEQLDAVGAVVEAMPDLLGADVGAAEEFAERIGLVLLIERVAPGNVLARPGSVISQQPDAGVTVVPGSVLVVQIFDPAA